MGMGDELMAIGEAQKLIKNPNETAVVINTLGKRIPSKLNSIAWGIQNDENMPATHTIINCSGRRPYINNVSNGRIIYNDYSPIPARLNLNKLPRDPSLKSKKYLIIEPTIKFNGNENKQWGFIKYQEVVNKLKHITFIQLLSGNGGKMLDNVMRINTRESLHKAIGILNNSLGYVGNEGGTHHLMAALNKWALVMFGGYIHPEQTGYSFHTNLKRGDKPCGSIRYCNHCTDAMNQISVEEVISIIEKYWETVDGREILGTESE